MVSGLFYYKNTEERRKRMIDSDELQIIKIRKFGNLDVEISFSDSPKDNSIRYFHNLKKENPEEYKKEKKLCKIKANARNRANAIDFCYALVASTSSYELRHNPLRFLQLFKEYLLKQDRENCFFIIVEKYKDNESGWHIHGLSTKPVDFENWYQVYGSYEFHDTSICFENEKCCVDNEKNVQGLYCEELINQKKYTRYILKNIKRNYLELKEMYPDKKIHMYCAHGVKADKSAFVIARRDTTGEFYVSYKNSKSEKIGKDDEEIKRETLYAVYSKYYEMGLLSECEYNKLINKLYGEEIEENYNLKTTLSYIKSIYCELNYLRKNYSEYYLFSFQQTLDGIIWGLSSLENTHNIIQKLQFLRNDISINNITDTLFYLKNLYFSLKSPFLLQKMGEKRGVKDRETNLLNKINKIINEIAGFNNNYINNNNFYIEKSNPERYARLILFFLENWLLKYIIYIENIPKNRLKVKAARNP